MKYKAKIYAEALVDLLLDKKCPIDDKKITDNFLKLLETNGDMKKSKEIILLAEHLFLKKTGNRKIILEVARKVDTKNFIKSFIRKGDIVEEKVNPEIIAGIKIIVDNDKQLDFSLSGKLQNIF